jgi:hypothetical protein
MEVSATTLVLLLVIGGMTALIPRHLMIVPLFLIACLVPHTEEIVILGFNFQPARVVVLVGMLRALLGAAGKRYRFVPLDGLILFWGLNLSLMTLARRGDFSAFVGELGRLYEIFGLYFMARLTIQSRAQLLVALQTIAYCVILSFFLAAAEFLLLKKPLAYLYQTVSPDVHVRAGKIRVEGVFPHSIVFGNFMCVGGTLCWALAQSRLVRGAVWLGLAGGAAAIGCVGLSNSGTPLSTLLLSLVAIALFYYRPAVPWVIAGTVAFVTLYHFAWGRWWGLICRASAIVGGSGYHRAELINQFIQRLDEWAFMGTDTVQHWNIVGDPANQWVTEGLNGGLLGLLLFTAVIGTAFSVVHRAVRVAQDDREKALFWGVGCALFAFCVSFLGLANFGQINVLWFGVLGMIGSIAESLKSLPAGGHARRPHAARAPGGAPHRPLPGSLGGSSPGDAPAGALPQSQR